MLKVLLVIFVICFVIERLIPGWKLPHVKTWPIRVLLLNLVQIGVVTLAGYTWELWFSTWSIFQISNYLSPLSSGAYSYAT